MDFGISIPTIKSSTRNLLFELGGPMERVLPALIDRSRAPLDLDTIQTILGYQRRPRYRTRKRRSTEWEVTVEKPTYDLTILRLHGGQLTLKIYTKANGYFASRPRRTTSRNWIAGDRWRNSPGWWRS